MGLNFGEQLNVLVDLFVERKVSVEPEGVIKLSGLTVVEKYVLTTAISLGRCSEVNGLENSLYRMTWEKDILMDIDTQSAVLSGLDNYICDTGGMIHAVENGDYDGIESDVLVDYDLLVQLNETARMLFRAIEVKFDAWCETRTEEVVHAELVTETTILCDLLVDRDKKADALSSQELFVYERKISKLQKKIEKLIAELKLVTEHRKDEV